MNSTATHNPTSDTAPSSPVEMTRACLALLAGLALLIAAFANMTNLTRWADAHGTVTVYLGFFLVMSVAGRQFWNGTDSVVAAVRAH